MKNTIQEVLSRRPKYQSIKRKHLNKFHTMLSKYLALMQGHHPRRVLIVIRDHGALHLYLQARQVRSGLLHLGSARLNYQNKYFK